MPTRRTTKRRTRSAWRGPIIAVAVTSVVLASVVVLVSVMVADALTDVRDGDTSWDPGPSIHEPSVAGYGAEQLANACHILAAGRDLGLDERDQTIAVMTAMGESALRNLEYGDWETSGVTNPDGSRTTSIGLFQQQDGWGSREARLDPYTAASMFYRAMTTRVPDRAAVEPTLVAHRTQINDDPLHYERFWDRAVRVVAALNGAPLDGDRTDSIALCPAA